MRAAFLILLLLAAPAAAQTITVSDEVTATLGPETFGIQYHRNTYSALLALEKLAPLPLRGVRIWAYPSRFHPTPTTWDWEELDTMITEAVAAGYDPWVCLFQAETWYAGTPEDPWWHDADARAEWARTAAALAERYADTVDRWIVFDEINILHPSRPAYMSPTLAAELYVEAAEAIRQSDPGAQIGGPSNFAGWENGYWAQRVLAQPGGAEALDFVSSNLFLSWDADDTNDEILSRTIWYEEAATKMRDMIGTADDPALVLDAYNVSALWTRDGTPTGDLWTDPRNVDTFGGVVQTLAQLHALQGGFDTLLRWETLGGFGILRWYPAFEERPPYWAWRLLTEAGRLRPGATLLRAETTEPPLPDLPHHSGQNAAGHEVQPFAVRDATGTSVVLVNKTEASREVTLLAPHASVRPEVYRFDASRHASALDPIRDLPAVATDAPIALTLPGTSVTVVSFGTAASTASETTPADGLRLTVAPTPYRESTRLGIETDRGGHVSLTLWSVQGRRIATLMEGPRSAGTASVAVPSLAPGTYLARLCVDAACVTQPLTRTR
ncbi:MAG: hypothetical protein AAF791_10965 [Bacteroidota bacterium]